MAASAALKKMNWEPIHLQSKEGLALINGTQFMNAYGLICLKKAEQLLEMANLIAALSIDAFDCRIDPFLTLSHAIRPHKGQIETAANVFNWLKLIFSSTTMVSLITTLESGLTKIKLNKLVFPWSIINCCACLD